MFEKFRPIFNPKEEVIKIYKPMDGLEGRTFTLEEAPDADGLRPEPKDDWVMHDEVQTSTGEFEVAAHRRNEDGSVEVREGIPAGDFLAVQDEQAPLRRERARRDAMVQDSSEVRQSLVEAVRGTKTYKRNRTLGDIALMDFYDDKNGNK